MMENGPRSLFDETKDYFSKLNKYLEAQLALLEGNAQAESRLVSAFVEKIAIENVKHILSRMDKAFVKDSKKVLSDNALILKLRNKLNYALEFFADHNQIVSRGAYFVPIRFHQVQAPKTLQMYNEGKALLEKLNKALSEESPTKNKSWFPQISKLANLLVNFRTIAFGFENTNRFKRSADEISKVRDAALSQLTQTCNDFAKLQAKPFPSISKTSREMLTCENYCDIPKADLYFKYCPDLTQLGVFVKDVLNTDKDKHSTESLHEKLVYKPQW